MLAACDFEVRVSSVLVISRVCFLWQARGQSVSPDGMYLGALWAVENMVMSHRLLSPSRSKSRNKIKLWRKASASRYAWHSLSASVRRVHGSIFGRL